MTRFKPILLAGLGAAALALPASASAVPTFCVNADPCPAGTPASLSSALKSAQDVDGPADIILGANGGTPYVGPFVYHGGPSATNTVTIKGQGRPIVTTATAASDVLSIDGPVGSAVYGIDVKVPALPNVDGLVLAGAEAGDVRVSGGGSATGVDRGVVMSGGARFVASRIDIAGFGVEVVGGTAELNLDDVKASVGVIGADTDLRIERSTIEAGFQGVQLIRGAGGSAPRFHDGLMLLDTEVTTSGANGQGVFARDAEVLLDRASIAGRSAAPAAGASALRFETLERSVDLFVTTTVLGGYDRGLVRTSSNGRLAALEIFESEWDASRDLDGGQSAGPISRTRFVDAAPRFVDRLGGDLRLRGGDGAIDVHGAPFGDFDKGDTDGHGAVDGDGDGVVKTDAGAREYARRAPVIETFAATAAGETGAPLAFSAGASDGDGEGVELEWRFGDGTGATGSSVTHAYRTPGTHRVTLTARDEGGATVIRTADVVVSGDPIVDPPPVDQTPPVETAPGPIAPAGGATDRTAPSLSGATLSVRRRALRGRKVRLAVTTSEAATLKIAAGKLKRTVAVPRGRSTKTVVLTRRTLRALARRRARLTVVAVDAAGNRSPAKRLRLTVRR